MSENNLWKKFRKILKTNDFFHQRIEDKLSQGIPDVYFHHDKTNISGWIELKYRENFPKRAMTPVRFSHYSEYQRAWLRRANAAGINVGILAEVGKELFYFPGGTPGFEKFGELTRLQMNVYRVDDVPELLSIIIDPL